MTSLKLYLSPALKWWWLIIAAGIVATASAFFITRGLPPVYRASTTLLIGRSIYEANPNSAEFGLNQQLANVYIGIALQEPVQQAVREALGLPELPDFEVNSLGNGQFIEIAVTDTDAARAQAVARQLADELIRLTPSGSQSDSTAREEFINAQLDDLQAQIAATLEAIAERQAALTEIVSARELDDAQAELAALQTRLDILQTNYANLLGSSPAYAANTLTVIEPAALPVRPIGPNTLLLTLLSGAAGMALAIAAAYGMEFLDDTFRSPEEVVRLLDLPILGSIDEIRRRDRPGLIVDRLPNSTAAECFRSLRTNLEFAAASTGKALKTIVVTSPGTAEGKTTVAANLALLMAQGGRQVILVDADLRHPRLHQVFELYNDRGLSDLLQSDQNPAESLRVRQGQPLWILTAGTTTSRSAELLASRRMDQVLAALADLADVVVIDAPPCLVPDAWIVAAKASSVICVARLGHTPIRAAQAMLEQLDRCGAAVLGLVLNRHNRSSDYYYRRPAPERPRRQARERAAPPAGRVAQLPQPAGLSEEPARPPSAPRAVLAPASAAPEEGADPVTRQQALATLDLITGIERDLADDGLTLEELGVRVLQRTVHGLGAASGSLMLFDQDGQLAAGAVAYLGRVQSAGSEALGEMAAHGLAGWVREHRTLVRLDNTRTDPRWRRRAWDEPPGAVRSALSAPLLAGDRVAGVLTLAYPRAGQFTWQDLALLKAVVASVSFGGAPALLNAQPHPAPGRR